MTPTLPNPLPNDQIDFAFVADLPTAPLVAKKRRASAKVGAKQPAPAVPAAAPPLELANDVEALARQLEAHPDYRVLRRLQPRVAWGAARPGTKLCRVLVLDTETTGLDQSKDRIIELALLRVEIDTDTGLPVGEVQVYDGLEDPGIPIPKEVQGITGIDDDMVRGKTLDEVRVAQLLEGVDLVIAHNAAFDRPFVEARLARFGQLAWACSFADISWREQGRNSAKLESLALELGYFYDAHRAEMDCHALLAVLARPLPKAPQTGLAHLIAQSSQWSYRLQATNAPFDAKDKLKARAYRWNGEKKVWHTRLDDADSLRLELEWLKVNVYPQRSAMVQVEKLDARVRYSARAGSVQMQPL